MKDSSRTACPIRDARLSTLDPRLFLLLSLSLLLCSCVSYTYTFQLPEAGETKVILADDSLMSCTVTPLFASSSTAYATVRIMRKGAREIVVRSLTSRLMHSGHVWNPGGRPENITASRMLPHSNVWSVQFHVVVEHILDFDPEFRLLSEAEGTRGLSYDYHYGHLLDVPDEALLQLTLTLLVDGVERTLTREINLGIESKAHWGTLRLAH
jgi:hypothetical protein